ncbi:DUF2007 domain-containing protein [Stieleria sp. TO1_6]|uniref:putative signal transducing protein n=1 Tax=Stieleria tagensis TaxID=2956795 RepID=UPI00209B0CC3|nr:DUF2007 domain-containing protein [Stieleria tagensis]MCO8121927.1 DUF2007 domain-containing protein [Stieleria tagensis]
MSRHIEIDARGARFSRLDYRLVTAAMQTLRIVGNSAEAEILRSRLDAAGILAVVNGAEVATMLSHIGSAVVRVRVEVAPEDYDRANQLLADDEQDRAQRTAWNCNRCGERNEPLFDFCWSCNKQREDSDPAASVFESEDSDAETFGQMSVNEPEVIKPPDNNPYAPVILGRERPPQPVAGPGVESDPVVVDTVMRVFRGAVVGTVIIPPLISLYALGTLLTTVPMSAYRDPPLRWRLIASWLLCLLGIGFGVIVWSGFVAMIRSIIF